MKEIDLFNTINLRNKMQFEIRLSSDVFWVPVCSLGETTYTNKEMKEIVLLSPEQKRKKITNLYEAIQLFQLSHFKNCFDNRNIIENGIEWEHHKPGYFSVYSNCGCCASVASWLTYVIDGSYEEIGIISFSRNTGNGHALNYIKHNDWYYITDLLAFEDQYIHDVCVETGKLSDFRKSKYITGICIKAKTIEAYVNFYDKYLIRVDAKYLFFMQREKMCLPCFVKYEGTKICINFPKDSNVICIKNNHEPSHMSWIQIDPPQVIPDWTIKN